MSKVISCYGACIVKKPSRHHFLQKKTMFDSKDPGFDPMGQQEG